MPNVEQCLALMESSSNVYIRTNTLKIGPKPLLSLLEARNIEVEHTEVPEVFRVVSTSVPIGATPEYLAGLYYIQDLSSCIAVEELDLSLIHI